MILVDSSIWIDHVRSEESALTRLLEEGLILGHPWVAGELALGQGSRRDEAVGLVRALPQATVADSDEVLRLIELESLHGSGIGYVDAQLLASTRLTPDAWLWSRDRRLATVAGQLGVASNRRHRRRPGGSYVGSEP